MKTTSSPLGYQALFDFRSIAAAVRFARRHRCDFVELHLNNLRFYRELEQLSRRPAFDFLVHAADGFNLFAPSAGLRDAAVEYLKYQIDLAGRLRARGLTFHIMGDVPFAINGVKHFSHEFFPRECRTWLARALAAVMRHARGKIDLCVENTAAYRYRFVHELVDSRLGTGLNLTWDLGHTNCLSGSKQRAELAFFERRRSYIRNCHLHDNDRHHDLHLPIGAGRLEFDRFLSVLGGARPFLTVETRPKTNVIRSLRQLRRILS